MDDGRKWTAMDNGAKTRVLQGFQPAQAYADRNGRYERLTTYGSSKGKASSKLQNTKSMLIFPCTLPLLVLAGLGASVFATILVSIYARLKSSRNK